MNTKTDSEIAFESKVNAFVAHVENTIYRRQLEYYASLTVDDQYSKFDEMIGDYAYWIYETDQSDQEYIYEILQLCYGDYRMMCINNQLNKIVNQALQEQIENKKLPFSADMHPLDKIVNVVFHEDLGRASSYCLALRIALQKDLKMSEIAGFFLDAGGVEAICRADANGGKP